MRSWTEISNGGISGYDLASPNDRVFPYDYDSSGKQDHLVLYRPGTGIIWMLRNNGNGTFSDVYWQAQSSYGDGLGSSPNLDYDLLSTSDRGFGFDFNSSGKQDHIALYRPGAGLFWVFQNNSGIFSAVYATDSGVGVQPNPTYDLMSPYDQVFPFDWNGSGKQDHIALYRPGARLFWVMQMGGGSPSAVYISGNGVGPCPI